MSVSVLGGGAFGTALAISLAREAPATLWARDAARIKAEGENTRRLPGHPLPQDLTVTDDLGQACQADILLLALPMQSLRGFASEHRALLADKHLVACCKGIDLETGLGPTAILRQTTGNPNPAVLTGPSFAADIAQGLPTALTLACQDDEIGKTLQKTLTTSNLRLYRTTDTIGAELGGALKNVIAIACGTAMGAGLGESACAALMTRGYAEMQRLAAHLGAEAKTLSGLSGFGDLTLTCTSTQSRNYRFGLGLGAGTPFDSAETVEGVATARAAHKIAQDNQLEMPITAAVAGLLDKTLDVDAAMHSLLTRPLKEE